MVCQAPHIGIWAKVGRYVGYKMGQFFPGFDALMGVPWANKSQSIFFDTFRVVKRYLAFTYFIIRCSRWHSDEKIEKNIFKGSSRNG